MLMVIIQMRLVVTTLLATQLISPQAMQMLLVIIIQRRILIQMHLDIKTRHLVENLTLLVHRTLQVQFSQLRLVETTTQPLITL